MVEGYEEIEHPSDVGLSFRGRDLEELFENAGLGMFSLITDIDTVRPSRKMDLDVSFETDNLEDMLIIWLEKLLYYFEVEGMLFSKINIRHMTDNSMKGNGLRASLSGEKLNRGRHRIINAIKAPTYHHLSIVKDEKTGYWNGSVIFDV